MPGEEPFAAEDKSKMVGQPMVVFQSNAFGEIEVEVGHLARDVAVDERGLQQPQPEIGPAKVAERHVDQQDARHDTTGKAKKRALGLWPSVLAATIDPRIGKNQDLRPKTEVPCVPQYGYNPFSFRSPDGLGNWY